MDVAVSSCRYLKQFAAGIGLGYVTVSVAESLLHSRVYHASRSLRRRLARRRLGQRIARGYMSHSIVHHRMTYRRDHVTQFDSTAAKLRIQAWAERSAAADRILRDRYGLTVAAPDGIVIFTLPVVPIFALYGALTPTPMRVGLAAALAAFPMASRWLHPYLHMSREDIERQASPLTQRFLATRPVRYVARNHWLHHRDATVNFNLLPFGDWLLGRHRSPTGVQIAEMRSIGMLV